MVARRTLRMAKSSIEPHIRTFWASIKKKELRTFKWRGSVRQFSTCHDSSNNRSVRRPSVLVEGRIRPLNSARLFCSPANGSENTIVNVLLPSSSANSGRMIGGIRATYRGDRTVRWHRAPAGTQAERFGLPFDRPNSWDPTHWTILLNVSAFPQDKALEERLIGRVLIGTALAAEAPTGPFLWSLMVTGMCI